MWWCRDISQTCLMLPVSVSSRWWTRNASCCGRRPPPGRADHRTSPGRRCRTAACPGHRPGPGQHRLGGRDQRGRGLGSHPGAGRRRQRRRRRSAPAGPRRQRRRRAGPHLPARPAPCGVPRPSARWATSVADIPRSRRRYQPRAGRLTRSPACWSPDCLPTASVARVVATRDSSGIGMAAPVRTASTNALQLRRWPLSCPASTRRPFFPLDDHTVTRWKLSSRPIRPSPMTSRVSFGKRGLPSVR